MADYKYQVTSDGSITLAGNVYTITFPNIPEGITLRLNETVVQPGVPISITANATGEIEVTPKAPVTLEMSLADMSVSSIDNVDVTDGETITLEPGNHRAVMAGATSIPEVRISGTGITSLSINGNRISSDLPYSFTPLGGMTNTIDLEGQAVEEKTVTIASPTIKTVNIDGATVNLPYTYIPTIDSVVTVAQEEFQLDILSKGGAVITQDGASISEGNQLHKVVTILKDTYLEIDGGHTLTISGKNVQDVNINGLTYDTLPQTVKNYNITPTLDILGNEDSDINITGANIANLSIDGVPAQVENGIVDVSFQSVKDEYNVLVNGDNRAEYNALFDIGAASVEVDGKTVNDGDTVPITRDVFIEAFSAPVEITFDAPGSTTIRVNGKEIENNETYPFSTNSNVSITDNTCNLTIDYIDNSYTITVPAGLVNLTAPHMDWWLFDGWSSNDVGIVNPKQVKCLIDLTGKTDVHLVCHYQQYQTRNKPSDRWS